MTTFRGKVIVITGASSGIGEYTAYAFAKLGGSVVLAARSVDKLAAVAEQCQKLGGEPLTVAADVSKETDCQNLIEKTVERFGRIDVLINNAGISMRAIFNDSKVEVLQQVMAINFWGSVYCTKYALPYLLKNQGSLLGISSIAGYKGLPGRTGYSASKFALQGFLECIRIEHLKEGLHVGVICPGFTASNIRKTALNAGGQSQGESPRKEEKMMQPDEVAQSIVQNVVGRKRQTILTGQGKLTVWLSKWFPAWTDKLVYNHMAKEDDSPLKK